VPHLAELSADPARLSLVARAPVRVVDGGVLEQRREDEHEADDQVDVDRLDVRYARQRRPHRRTDRRHRQDRRYAYAHHQFPGRGDLEGHTVILIVILIIIGIPSPNHSFTLGLNPSFSANPPYRTLFFFSFRFHYMDLPDCLLLLLSISVFLLFSFSVFYTFLVVGSVR